MCLCGIKETAPGSLFPFPRLRCFLYRRGYREPARTRTEIPVRRDDKKTKKKQSRYRRRHQRRKPSDLPRPRVTVGAYIIIRIITMRPKLLPRPLRTLSLFSLFSSLSCAVRSRTNARADPKRTSERRCARSELKCSRPFSLRRPKYRFRCRGCFIPANAMTRRRRMGALTVRL